MHHYATTLSIIHAASTVHNEHPCTAMFISAACQHTLPVTQAGENLLYLLYSSKNQLIMRLPALISGPGMSMYGPIMDLVCCEHTHTALFSSAVLLLLSRSRDNAHAISRRHIMLKVCVLPTHVACIDGHRGCLSQRCKLLIGLSTASALWRDGGVCFGVVV